MDSLYDTDCPDPTDVEDGSEIDPGGESNAEVSELEKHNAASDVELEALQEQIRIWLKTPLRGRKPRITLRSGYRYSVWAVIRQLYHDRIRQKLLRMREADGEESGKSRIDLYQRALTAFMQEELTDEQLEAAYEIAEEWNGPQGPSAEVKARNAHKYGIQYVRNFAHEMWRYCGMRMVFLTGWKNESGIIQACPMDFNDEIYDGNPFNDIHTLDGTWRDYVGAAFEEQGEPEEDMELIQERPMAKSRKVDPERHAEIHPQPCHLSDLKWLDNGGDLQDPITRNERPLLVARSWSRSRTPGRPSSRPKVPAQRVTSRHGKGKSRASERASTEPSNIGMDYSDMETFDEYELSADDRRRSMTNTPCGSIHGKSQSGPSRLAENGISQAPSHLYNVSRSGSQPRGVRRCDDPDTSSGPTPTGSTAVPSSSNPRKRISRPSKLPAGTETPSISPPPDSAESSQQMASRNSIRSKTPMPRFEDARQVSDDHMDSTPGYTEGNGHQRDSSEELPALHTPSIKKRSKVRPRIIRATGQLRGVSEHDGDSADAVPLVEDRTTGPPGTNKRHTGKNLKSALKRTHQVGLGSHDEAEDAVERPRKSPRPRKPPPKPDAGVPSPPPRSYVRRKSNSTKVPKTRRKKRG
ncbi:hypothetical protein EDD15DRAFT_2194562 [Pisolithus albus]|nr:hypothetical protein EDD15DRAFT_2194562 [Pisolithus albus]